MPLADAHCHLDFDVFDVDRDELLVQCKNQDIGLLVVPSVDRENWEAVLRLAERYPLVSPCIGLHPYFIDRHKEKDLLALEVLLRERNDVVAIGEIGLDATVGDLNRQVYFLERQIELANELHLPVVMHSRQTHNLLLKTIKQQPPLFGGLLHGFSGSVEQAKAFWKEGIYLGVGGVISYERAKKTRRTFSEIPLDAVVLETDSPDMPLYGRQGQRNTPLSVIEIYKEFNALRDESEVVVYRQLWENTLKLFGVSRLETD